MAPKKTWRKAARISDEANNSESKTVAPSGCREAEWQQCVRIDEGARQVKVEMAGWALEDDDMDEWCSWFGAHLERAAVRTAVGAPVKLTAKEVDFSDNELTSMGMSKLLDVLMKYQLTVLILKLHHNRITSAGNLSMFLAACKGTLRELHMSHNELSTSAAGQIMISAAAVKDIDGKLGYPQPTKGGEGLAPFWLRMEHNLIDHKLLTEAVESAFAELRRPGRLFCSINGRGCTPRCCMRYREETPAVHVKFLTNQRPRPDKADEEEAVIYEEVRKMLPLLSASSAGHTASGAKGTSKGGGRGKQLAIGAAPGAKPSAAPAVAKPSVTVAAPRATPAAAVVGAARAEPTRGATRVWKVKEAPPSQEVQSEAKASFPSRALPKALRESRETSTVVELLSPSCTDLRAEKSLEEPHTQLPSKLAEDTASLEAPQGKAAEHPEPPAEDCLLDKVQPCESSTVSEGETRSSSEPAQEGSCSQSSYSGLDTMPEALVTPPSENPEEGDQPSALQTVADFAGDKENDAISSRIGTSDGIDQAPALESENTEVEETQAAVLMAPQPQARESQHNMEKALPDPPSQPPTLDCQLEEKTLPDPPSQPPALDKQPAEKTLPVPPSKPPALESHSIEKRLPDPPTQPPALDNLPAEKTPPEPPEELWMSMMYDDENPARKGNPSLRSSLNPAAAEFVPGRKISISVKASTRIQNFALNPQAPTFIPTMTVPSKSTASAAVALGSARGSTSTVPSKGSAAAKASADASLQEVVENSARAVLSAIRAARASQMQYVGSASGSGALMDDDESDDGLGIASVAWSSAGEDAPTDLRETSRPETCWQRVLVGWFRAPQQLLLAFLQQRRNSPGRSASSVDSRHIFVHSRATLYVLAIALSSFMLRMVLRAAAKWRK